MTVEECEANKNMIDLLCQQFSMACIEAHKKGKYVYLFLFCLYLFLNQRNWRMKFEIRSINYVDDYEFEFGVKCLWRSFEIGGILIVNT